VEKQNELGVAPNKSHDPGTRPGKVVFIPILIPVLFQGHQYPEVQGIKKSFIGGSKELLVSPVNSVSEAKPGYRYLKTV
jgi:hypothetical protein